MGSAMGHAMVAMLGGLMGGAMVSIMGGYAIWPALGIVLWLLLTQS